MQIRPFVQSRRVRVLPADDKCGVVCSPRDTRVSVNT